MEISQLKAHLQTHGPTLVEHIRKGSYHPSPIKVMEIPKANGKTRMLGIPTLTDWVIQQALYQAGEPVFEPDFQRHSYGFRPNRNAQQATRQAQRNINEAYQHVIDIDLKSFFDQVDHAILLELVHRKVTCQLTMKLLRKLLRAPMQTGGTLHKRRKGVPQGSARFCPTSCSTSWTPNWKSGDTVTCGMPMIFQHLRAQQTSHPPHTRSVPTVV